MLSPSLRMALNLSPTQGPVEARPNPGGFVLPVGRRSITLTNANMRLGRSDALETRSQLSATRVEQCCHKFVWGRVLLL